MVASDEHKREANRARLKRWEANHPGARKSYWTGYYADKKANILRHQKIYVADNKIETAEYQKRYQVTRRKLDPGFRVLGALRQRLYRATRGKKSASTLALLGCAADELKVHLESLFQPGMSWENYGKWHVDHRRPCASFDLVDPAQQRECFHYTNLQPLWALDNLQKGARHVGSLS
jgi:hypothetical protein